MTRDELLAEMTHLIGLTTLIEWRQMTTVVPPAFLMIDTYHYLMEHCSDLLETAITLHPEDCIRFLIQRNQFVIRMKPLFNSVRIYNKNQQFVQISNGETYVYAPKQKVISQLIENKRQILHEYVANHAGQHLDRSIDLYRHHIDSIDDTTTTIRKDLENDIMCMILDVSEIIGTFEWFKRLRVDLSDRHQHPPHMTRCPYGHIN